MAPLYTHQDGERTLIQCNISANAAKVPCATQHPVVGCDTLGVLLKYQDDIPRMEGSEAKRLLNQVKEELRLLGK